MKALSKPSVKHALIAVGVAAAAALESIPKAGHVDWRLVGVTSGQAFLAALGIGYVARKK